MNFENFFLTVSSLNYRKNFITVLQSFSKFSEIYPTVKLFIVGDLHNSVFKTVDIEEYRQNPQIKFLGRVSDEELVKYYQNALGFIFPSLYEGFGIPVLEAQACGCPVISSNSSSLPEVLNDSALMCDALNIDDYVQNMQRLCEDNQLRESLIKKGYENVKRFSWDKSTEKILQIMSDNIE